MSAPYREPPQSLGWSLRQIGVGWLLQHNSHQPWTYGQTGALNWEPNSFSVLRVVHCHRNYLKEAIYIPTETDQSMYSGTFCFWLLTRTLEISGPRLASWAAQSGQCEGVRTFSGIPRHLSFLWKHSGQTQTGKCVIWLEKKWVLGNFTGWIELKHFSHSFHVSDAANV